MVRMRSRVFLLQLDTRFRFKGFLTCTRRSLPTYFRGHMECFSSRGQPGAVKRRLSIPFCVSLLNDHFLSSRSKTQLSTRLTELSRYKRVRDSLLLTALEAFFDKIRM